MTKPYDYTAMVDNAMRGVVRDVMRQVQANGLVEPHHFFITFRTDHPGVVMSNMLRSKYPHEITIVLQHQFRELRVEQDQFKVLLSFNNIPEKLVIPFAALVGFADPSTKFGLQFHSDEEAPAAHAEPQPAGKLPARSTEEPAEDATETTGGTDKVITLDAFRKK